VAISSAIGLASCNGGGFAYCKASTNDIDTSDRLFETRGGSGNLSKNYELLVELYQNPANRAEVCFRLARSCYNLISSKDPLDAYLNDTTEKKKKLAEEALRYAQEALDHAPNDFRSYYWNGIAIQSMGEFEGTKYTISRLNDIRGYFEQAADLSSSEDKSTAMVHYCLGSWCFSLANLGWLSRKVASTVFASPPTASFEEALEHFKRAEEVNPGFWNKNTLMIAECYYKLGDKEKAYEWAVKAVETPFQNVEDEVSKQAAQNLVSRLS